VTGTPTPIAPQITGGVSYDGSEVSGQGPPNRPHSCIKIYDCGLNKICQDGDDQVIGDGSTNAAGFFTITLRRALVAGEEIYARDDCLQITGPITVVARPAPVPVLSPAVLVVLSAALSVVGLLALAQTLRKSAAWPTCLLRCDRCGGRERRVGAVGGRHLQLQARGPGRRDHLQCR
jgi:hypothetical protein